MIEKEVKILLSEAQYELVKSLFNWDSQAIQTNYYYGDINTVEYNSELTIRIRDKKGSKKLQIKKPVRYDEALHVKEEFEKPVDTIPDMISNEELREMVGMDYPDVSLLGTLETLRFTCNWNENTEICLDTSKYFENTDYELEVEFKEELPAEIIERLQEHGIVPEKKVNGKFARFMSAYLKKHGKEDRENERL